MTATLSRVTSTSSPRWPKSSSLKVPEGLKLDGRSRVPLLKNPKADWPDRFLFTHVGRWEKGKADESKFENCAVRNARFQLVNDTELYDLKSDPGETNNVISEFPEVVANARGLRPMVERNPSRA